MLEKPAELYKSNATFGTIFRITGCFGILLRVTGGDMKAGTSFLKRTSG
jgi:hypothetical protein